MVAGLYWLFAVVAAVTLQSSGPTLRVAVAGDTGDGSEAVARGIAKLRPDAVILTGDNFYKCGVNGPDDPKWSRVEPLINLGIPIYPILGNHDVCGDEEAEVAPRFKNWIFPSREYVIHSDVAEFVMIDTTNYVNTIAPPPVVNRFTNGKWRIVVGHHPILSSGYHGYMPRAEHQQMLRLLPNVRAAKVDLYVSGHDHHLELLEDNPRMLVSGAGSQPIPAVMRRGATKWISEAPFIGFAMLELTAKTMTIRFYDEKGRPRSKPFTYSR